jgi:hypothetical protein
MELAGWNSAAEGKLMGRYLPTISLACALLLGSGVPAVAETTAEDFYREWVDYRDGEISIAFEQIPVQFALLAIHAKTGFEIVMPAHNSAKVVNLRLHRQPFEPAIRSLISTIGYKNFALMYDDSGRPNRAIVLGAHLQIESAATKVAERDSADRPLSAEERVNLQKSLARWNDLNKEERGRIEDRLKSLPPSQEREQLIKEYGQQVLGLNK